MVGVQINSLNHYKDHREALYKTLRRATMNVNLRHGAQIFSSMIIMDYVQFMVLAALKVLNKQSILIISQYSMYVSSTGQDQNQEPNSNHLILKANWFNRNVWANV